MELILTNNNELSLTQQAIELVQRIRENKRKAEEDEALLKEAMLTAMKNNNVVKFESDQFNAQIIAATTRKSLDSTRLKKELPDIYEEFSKVSEVKESLRLTIK